jgi:hypothetical protein
MAHSRKHRPPKNAREVAFCEAWLENGYNHVEAYKTAGYSTRGGAWRSYAAAMMESFRKYLEPLQRARAKAKAQHLSVTEKDVLDELSAMAFASPLDYVELYTQGDTVMARKKEFHQLTRRQAAAVTGVQVLTDGKVVYSIPEPKDRRPAVELVGKHLGMFHTQLIAEHRHILQRRTADLKDVNPTVLLEIEKILIESIGEDQAKQFIGYTAEAVSEEEDDAAPVRVDQALDSRAQSQDAARAGQNARRQDLRKLTSAR